SSTRPVRSSRMVRAGTRRSPSPVRGQDMTDNKTQLTQPRWTHIALPVSDLERSIEFYTTITPLVVVARNTDENGKGAWLSNDGQVENPFVLVIAEFIPEVGERFGVKP